MRIVLLNPEHVPIFIKEMDIVKEQLAKFEEEHEKKMKEKAGK